MPKTPAQTELEVKPKRSVPQQSCGFKEELPLQGVPALVLPRPVHTAPLLHLLWWKSRASGDFSRAGRKHKCQNYILWCSFP